MQPTAPSAATHELLTGFYDAFAKRDATTMAAAYAVDASFCDPVFPSLRGPEIGAMWSMLCERGADLRVEYRIEDTTATSGVVEWEAHYTFQATGRHVHNRVRATFELSSGRITRHHDAFDLWRWTRMALGVPGALLGWTPWMQNKIRRTAGHALSTYIQTRM